nr:MAG TPA: hypothetical protein [Caudoviricetes sp.]DAW86839.1 MAG TPA: hypothetical protein [Caudoviricetes sp.]
MQIKKQCANYSHCQQFILSYMLNSDIYYRVSTAF